ncbi:MAG: TetR family transcriptional regulator C-terminal domain-containing protein [Lachnospiraceae bacterium]|nr:TetR family transcriptional regulator C-terminal domain-containing protein [Lachnospiraceae bacterium]
MPLWSPDPVKQEYLSAYISAGVSAMIHTWVARDFAESVDEIVAMAVQSQGVSSPLP